MTIKDEGEATGSGPSRKRSFPSLLAAAAAALVLSAACLPGGDEAETPAPTPTQTPAGVESIRTAPVAASPSPTQAPAPRTGPLLLTYSLPFVWPATGPITSEMGPEHPSGIDIGLDVGGSLAVRAASSGVVVSAGGSEDDALGLSIVIEHGNGITTTYGHLSQLNVVEGDVVSTGDTIGQGGATGTATGVHLHFEVRQNGQTIDPLDVLPTGEAEPSVRELDCGNEKLSLPAGSLVRLDASGVLAAGEQLVGAGATGVTTGVRVEGYVGTRGTGMVALPLDFGPARSEEFRVDLTIDSVRGNRSITCDVTVQFRSVPTTFYVRADPGAPDHATAADEAPTPAPTATPSPTSSVEPQFEGPSVSNPAVGSPQYNAPGLATPVIQQPMFGSPSGGP